MGFVRRHRVRGRFELEDAVSVAFVGLCEAAKRWRPDGGAAFWSLAHVRITGALIDAWTDLPGHAKARQAKQWASVRQYDPKKDPRACEADQEETVLRGEVAAAIEALPGRAAGLISRRLQGDTLAEAGQGIHKSWACRIEAQAVAELRDRLGVAA
jgi:RNA polymerase sigma factor (sigma-70 family)